MKYTYCVIDSKTSKATVILIRKKLSRSFRTLIQLNLGTIVRGSCFKLQLRGSHYLVSFKCTKAQSTKCVDHLEILIALGNTLTSTCKYFGDFKVKSAI